MGCFAEVLEILIFVQLSVTLPLNSMSIDLSMNCMITIQWVLFYLDLLKKIKRQVFTGFSGLVSKTTEFIDLGSMGSRTQLIQIDWVLELSLPRLARFIKFNNDWVVETSLPSWVEFIEPIEKLDFGLETRWRWHFIRHLNKFCKERWIWEKIMVTRNDW